MHFIFIDLPCCGRWQASNAAHMLTVIKTPLDDCHFHCHHQRCADFAIVIVVCMPYVPSLYRRQSMKACICVCVCVSHTHATETFFSLPFCRWQLQLLWHTSRQKFKHLLHNKLFSDYLSLVCLNGYVEHVLLFVCVHVCHKIVQRTYFQREFTELPHSTSKCNFDTSMR